MRNQHAFQQLRAQAIALRRAGKSRRDIKQILGVGSNQTLNELLRGEPPQPSTWRPNAKDELRAKARALREQGLACKQIAAELSVSKSTVSAWVSDMPRPDRLSYEECRVRSASGVRHYWAAERQRRAADQAAVRNAAAAQIGSVSAREIVIAGAIAYWCEGTKKKTSRARVIFVNSDPALIRFFLCFLDTVGISRSRLIFRIHIHVSADVPAAERFWLNVTEADPSLFRRTTLKQHNPRTIRHNTGAGYHGCLRVEVRTSGDLYRRIEGWAAATMAALPRDAKLRCSSQTR
jgi:transposase